MLLKQDLGNYLDKSNNSVQRTVHVAYIFIVSSINNSCLKNKWSDEIMYINNKDVTENAGLMFSVLTLHGSHNHENLEISVISRNIELINTYIVFILCLITNK